MGDFARLSVLIAEAQARFDEPTTREAARADLIALWKKMNPRRTRPHPESLSFLPLGVSDEDAMVYAGLRPDQRVIFEEMIGI